MRKWLVFFLLLFPLLAFAQSSTGASGGAFSVAPTDKSMQYLGMILGNVPGTPIQTSKEQVSTSNQLPILQNLFYIFNQIIFALGLVVVAYTVIVGTITTAQEGEFLGSKKWHPILVPLRAGLGVFLLIPQTSGYNFIQITLIWFIVQGVGAANALWEQVIYYNQTKGSIHTDTQKANLLQVGNTVYAIFNSNMCMTVLNEDRSARDLLGEAITVYQWENTIQWGRKNHAGKEPALCGSVTIPNVSTNIFNAADDAARAAERKAILTSAILQAQVVLEVATLQALYGEGSTSSGPSTFITAANLLERAGKSLSTTFQTLTEINQEAITNGWILAGSYYFQIIQGTGIAFNIAYSSTMPNSEAINAILGAALGSQLLTQSNSAANNYAAVSAAYINAPSNQSQLQFNSSYSGSVGSLFSAMFGSLMNSVVKSLNTQMTSGKGDPLLSMASFGASLTTTCEITFWSMLLIFSIIFIGSTVFHCLQPLGPAIDVALKILVPMAILVISLLYGAGIVLALYIPLIPYLVFTFTALGWMFLVLESLLGAPLVGLSLIVPSEDELGRAGHAVMILLGIFLRPVLMILAFILAIQLVYIAFEMLNFGFWKTLVSSTGAASGVGVFGMVAILVMYAGIAAVICHEAFSLIYVLPNKVMRWIGASGEDEMGAQAKALKGSVEKGGAISKGIMTGAIDSAKPTLKGKGK